MPLSRILSTSSSIILLLAATSLAAIGPAGDLVITNIDAAPDGFNRRAISAGGGVTGTLVTATKGDQININVVNNLDDDTMLQATSIVCFENPFIGNINPALSTFAALAWFLSKDYELSRWRCFCKSMPYISWELLSICL
jgi:hypothetical protein